MGKVYKGGEEVEFISQFQTENHIVEVGVVVTVTGQQYSNFVDVKTNRNAKIRRVPVTSIIRTADKFKQEKPNPDTESPFFYKPRNTSKMKGPKYRSPEEDCFWLYATEEAKQGKILNIVNKALSGDLYFTQYADYQKWIKQALLATRF